MFSIIIPYYKKRNYIERCIDSVLNQTFKDFEIIVVDDGSLDNISVLCSKKYGDKVKLLTQENQGVSSARNTGIAHATNDYIAFLDADDYWHQEYLMTVYKTINITDSDLISTGFTNNVLELQKGKVNLVFNEMSEDEYLLKSTYSAIINSSAVIVKKDIYNKTSGFDVGLKRGEDIEMWLRLVKHSERFIKIENILSFYDLNIEGQATNKKPDFKYSFASKLAQFSKTDDKYRLFTKRFMYCRLFQYHFSNPEQTAFFIKELKLNSPFFSLYRINSSHFNRIRSSKLRMVINKYLKLTVRFIK